MFQESRICSKLASIALRSTSGQLHCGQSTAHWHQQSLFRHTNWPSSLQPMQLRAACTNLALRYSGRMAWRPKARTKTGHKHGNVTWMNEVGAVSTLGTAKIVFRQLFYGRSVNHRRPALIFFLFFCLPCLTYTWRQMQYAEIHFKFQFYCVVLLLLF